MSRCVVGSSRDREACLFHGFPRRGHERHGHRHGASHVAVDTRRRNFSADTHLQEYPYSRLNSVRPSSPMTGDSEIAGSAPVAAQLLRSSTRAKTFGLLGIVASRLEIELASERDP